MNIMRKTILSAVAVVILALFGGIQNGIAQSNVEDNREVLKFGFKLGANLSNVYDSEGEAFDADPKFGLVGGGFISIPIGMYIGVQPEVLFSQKGFKASGTSTLIGYEYAYTHTANYIDVPILLQLKASKSFTIMAGPQYSYLTNVKDEFEGETSSTDFKQDNLRKNTLCFLGGIGINSNRFVLDVRVGWDINNNNGDGTTSNPRYKNMWYQATLGYQIY